MSAIEKFVPEDNEIDRIQRIATNFANSGYFADATEALQAFVKISAGAEMGLQPFVSMSGISIIKGKPVVGAGILAGLLDAHPEFDYSVTWEPNSKEPTSCTVTVFKNGSERGQSSFSLEDAKKANLTAPSRNGEPSMYTKYLRNMLYARAMSNAVAWYAPSVTRSNGRVFVEGELDDAPAPPARPIATPRTAPTPDVSPEVVVEAELVDAAHESPVSSEDNPTPGVDTGESEQSASATPVQRTKAALASLSDDEREAVYEACDRLGVKRTVGAIVLRFGTDAYTRETLLPALAAAVNPPDTIEGEITAPMTAEEIAAARQFEAERDADGFGRDKTAEDIDGANARRDELSARLAAAGSFGES